MTPVLDRLLRRLDRSSTEGCWLWVGSKSHGGYGHIRLSGRGSPMAYTHRVMYEAVVGPIPDGLFLDHSCHTAALRSGTCTGGVCPHRACANPNHLSPVTQRQNLLMGRTGPAANLAKTHCIRGHPFSGPNLILRKSGVRECRTCANGSRRKTGEPTIWPGGESDQVHGYRVRSNGV
jgi:hypothetical protein